jgi:Sulfotransferase domain
VTSERPPATRHATPDWLRTGAKRTLRTWGVASAGVRLPPDFLLVGTKRGGTTSLHHYLLSHRDVVPMFPARRLKSAFYFTENYSRGRRWYLSHFATAPYRRARQRATGRPNVTGESSPYYLFHPLAAQRIAADLPTVKIIVMLRDPVKRAYSNYWERVDNGVETLSFADALAAEPRRVGPELERMDREPLYYSQAHDWYSYRERGVYAPQLRRYIDAFPDRLLIVGSEEFYADEQSTFDRVSDFLGIERQTLSARPRFNHRPAPAMDPAIDAELREFYQPHNAEVYDLIGRDLGWSR